MVNIPRLSLGNRPLIHKRSFLTTTKLTLFLLIVLIVMVGVMLPKVKVSQVQIRGQLACASHDQIRDRTELKGQSWVLIDAQIAEQNLKEQFPCLAEVKIARKLPDIIELVLSERQPVLVVQIAKKSDFPDIIQLEASSSSQEAQISPTSLDQPKRGFLVDRLGFIFSQELREAAFLPQIFLVDGQISLGQQIKGDLVSKTATILDRLAKMQVKVDQVKLVDQTLVVSSQMQLIFSLEKDDRRQLASLQLILQKAKMEAESKPIERIDLRFDKPVILYSPNKKKN